MADDPRQMLLAAGFPLDELTLEQREVVLGLRPDEIRLLIEISRQMAEAEPEVLAHESALVGGLLF
jgi:hypothetical protein